MKTKDTGRRSSIWMPQEYWDEVEVAAQNAGISSMEYIRRAVRDRLDEDAGKTDRDDEIEQAVLKALEKLGYVKRGEA